MNKIDVPHNTKKYLRSLFGVSYPTIRKALNGKTKGGLAPKIRKAALMNGGREMVEKESINNG